MGQQRHNQPEPGGRRNTLGLESRDLAVLLDQFDAGGGTRSDPNREFIRWPFRKEAIRVNVQHPGGAGATLMMACRNLSRSGLSLLHSCYMHPGTKCTVMLPHPAKGEMAVNGWVARCQHRHGVVHEIGVSFKEPIDVREWLRPDAFTDWYSLERVEAESLKGNVLYVDDSEMDVRILKHFLRGSSLNVRTAADVNAALAALESATPPDLILTDLRVAEVSGAGLVRAIRQRGCRSPIILLTSDTGDEARRLISVADPDACLSKPIDQNLLLRAIGEFLIVRRNRAESSGLRRDTETASLVQSFIGMLPQLVTQLESAIETRNVAQSRALCLQLAGNGPTLGFQHLGAAAIEAAKALEHTRDVGQSLKPLRMLVAACERIQNRAA